MLTGNEINKKIMDELQKTKCKYVGENINRMSLTCIEEDIYNILINYLGQILQTILSLILKRMAHY